MAADGAPAACLAMAPGCHYPALPLVGVAAASGPAFAHSHAYMLGHGAPCTGKSRRFFFFAPLAGSEVLLAIFAMSSAGGGAASGPSALPAWPAVVSTPAPTTPGAPAVLGDLPGFGSVPPRLIKKIMTKEYVDIWELLPETWQVETEGSCCHAKRPRRSLVTDINVWTECFATMAAILAAAFPAKAPHFFAYLRTITKASRTFESSAWASYDMAFRRQAGVPRLGARRRCPLQRGLRGSRQADTQVSLLPGRHSLVSGVSARSGGTPNQSHRQREARSALAALQARQAEPVLVSISAGSTTPREVPGAATHCAAMPTCARSADAHTHLPSAVTGDRNHLLEVSWLPDWARAGHPPLLGSVRAWGRRRPRTQHGR